MPRLSTSKAQVSHARRLRALETHRRRNTGIETSNHDLPGGDGFDMPTPVHAQSSVQFNYNDSLGLDDTKWHYYTKAAFDAAPRAEQRVWHHVGRLLFTEDGVTAEEPCARCATNGEACKVYSDKAQAERKQVVKLPIRCAHCVLLNIPCFSRRDARERREREEAENAEANPDESRQPRAAAAQPTYSLKQLTKNAGAYRYAEMYPPEPKKRRRNLSSKASHALNHAESAASNNGDPETHTPNGYKSRTAEDAARVSIGDLTETREKARNILNHWEVPLAEKDNPIKILLRQKDWFPRAKAEGWYHYGTTKAAQMRKMKGVKALQKQIKADEELQRKAAKQQKRDEKAEKAARREAARAQGIAPPAQMLPASHVMPPPQRPQWSEAPPPWAFPEWLSGSAPLPEPYQPYQSTQAPQAPLPMHPPKQPPSRKRKTPDHASEGGNLTRSYIRVKPLSWQYPKVATPTLLNYILSPSASDLLPDDPATVSYNSVPNPFTILLSSVMLSRPGYKPNTAHVHAHAAMTILLNAPYNFTSALAVQSAGEKSLMEALAESRQVHRPKIVMDVMKLVEVVQSDLIEPDDLDGTQLQRLRLQGGEAADFSQVVTYLSNILPSLNPTGLEAFFRRIQVMWPEYFPHLSKHAADSLKKLNFPQTVEPLMALIEANWSAVGQWAWAGADEDERKKRAFVVLVERAIAANYNDNIWEVMTAANGGDISSTVNYRPTRGGEATLADLLRSEATASGSAL